ncbi:MAG: PfkB family carbohydrate kinase [Parachlamydiales bacterium]|jgi:rfaE bifunctional protein nucleotidyltransferase chain/domain
MHKKVKTFDELKKVLEGHKKNGSKVVQCHGVFDLLHPGHIRYFKQAKSQGDVLVVTVTPDRFVNKGPGRPAFEETLRLETIAALDCVDYVVLNDEPDAVNAIKNIKPHFYVKGTEYKDASKDITGKIVDESNAVKSNGGKVFFTDDIVFSSSSLINRFIDPPSPVVQQFVSCLKKQYSLDDILQKIENLSDMRVLVIGDAIIDIYQYVNLLGQTGKGHHLVASCLSNETFLGGSLIISNHLAPFVKNVTLLTAVGQNCSYLNFVNDNLDTNVNREFVYLENKSTLTKKRYVLKDGENLTKLFETYSNNEPLLDEINTKNIISFIQKEAKNYDLVLICDFGNGFTNKNIINVISEVPVFLAINTQTNSGNRGFNVITHYKRADYISLNEPEIRLAAHDSNNDLKEVASKISDIIKCPLISVTRGINGVFCFTKNGSTVIPALVSRSIDRLGAGDSFLSLSSLCAAKKYSPEIIGFIGSVAAAMDVQIVGNRESIKKDSLCKFITRLMK